MKLFLDSADPDEIGTALNWGSVSGITTNPTLVSRAAKDDYLSHLKQVVKVIRSSGRARPSLSVEVFSTEPDDIVRDARRFTKELNYSGLAVKVHISHRSQNMLGAISALSNAGIAVNCTACMAPLQAYAAAAAGARS